MLLKCQISPSLKRVSQQASQPGSAGTAGSSSGSSSNQFVSGFGANRLPSASGKGKGGKGGKNIRNAVGVGGGGGVSSVSIGGHQSFGSPSAGVAAKLSPSPSSTVTSKLHRKVLRIPSKRIPGRVHSGKLASVASKLTASRQHLRHQQQQQQLQQHSQFGLQPPAQHPPTAATSCDNSNDSGLGFDRGIDSTTSNPQLAGQHQQQHQQQQTATTTTTTSSSLGSGAGRPIHHSSSSSSSGLQVAQDGNVVIVEKGGESFVVVSSNSDLSSPTKSVARSSSSASIGSLKRSHLALEPPDAGSTGTGGPSNAVLRSVNIPRKIIIPVDTKIPSLSTRAIAPPPSSSSLSSSSESTLLPSSSTIIATNNSASSISVKPPAIVRRPLSAAAAAPSSSASSSAKSLPGKKVILTHRVAGAGGIRTTAAKVMSSSLTRPSTTGRLPGKRPPLLQSALSGTAGTSSSAAYTNLSSSDVISTGQSQLPCATRDGKIHLQILTQPEQQHRARYQTEGSRGAVKDRSGNGFPAVRLVGYTKPAVLQVFIGTDLGRVLPHMFYQACKVSGKNSTPCVERKLEGTMVIEVDMKPENDMTVTCDCVGILKERNVDVEHRFPDQSGPRAKKKSTRCRMVFRTAVTNEDGSTEMLQVCSQPIVCTQPPGVPEICKKSLVSCPAEGGLELFIIGKNFLKDTKVMFQRRKAPLGASASSKTPIGAIPWEQAVIPDKEYLQQTHLICTVPPYVVQDIVEPVVVQIFIISANKKSETHNFTYTPKGHHTALTAATTLGSPVPLAGSSSSGSSSFFGSLSSAAPAAAAAVALQEALAGEVAAASVIGVGGGLPGGSSGNVTLGSVAGSSGGLGGGSGNTGTATSFHPLNSSFSSQASEDPSSLGDVSAVRRSLFFWGSQQQQQQQAQAVQDKLDTGMMPPPVHILPLTGTPSSTGRRSSLIAEQLAMSSPPSFKTELIDENSRSPLNDDSLERFPAASESSLDNSQIMYRRRSVRQPSMDLMEDSSSMSMLVNENSAMDVGSVPSTIVGFRSGLTSMMETNEMSNSSTSPSASELKVIDLCIKQEAHKLSSVRNQIEHMIAASSSSLDTLSQVDGMKSPYKVEEMLGAAVQQSGKQVIESTLASIVNSQQAAAAIMELGSVMSHPSSHPSMATSPPMVQSDIVSPGNTANPTPASQDVMLNAQPAAMAVTSPANLALATSPTSTDASPHPHAAMSPELILNPTVSPSSMICSPVNATAAATAAAAVAAAAAVSEGKNMLTNQVLNNMAAVAANIIESQPKETTQAVQDIILNAAAEILTSQEPSVTTQTTINALITMNAQEMMTTSCQSQTHTQHNLLPQCQPTPMVAETMADALQQQQQQQQQQQIVQNIITESLQQQQQQQTESLMANLAAAQQQQQQQQQHNQSQQPPPEQMDIGSAMISYTVQQPPQQPMDTTGPLLPMIQHQPQQQQQQQQQNQSPQMISNVMMQHQQQQSQSSQQLQQQQQQQQQQGQQQQPANIPQELTIMSDNDLISYINPNAFDGV